mgnify:CR=1 FL=1
MRKRVERVHRAHVVAEEPDDEGSEVARGEEVVPEVVDLHPKPHP